MTRNVYNYSSVILFNHWNCAFCQDKKRREISVNSLDPFFFSRIASANNTSTVDECMLMPPNEFTQAGTISLTAFRSDKSATIEPVLIPVKEPVNSASLLAFLPTANILTPSTARASQIALPIPITKPRISFKIT